MCSRGIVVRDGITICIAVFVLAFLALKVYKEPVLLRVCTITNFITYGDVFLFTVVHDAVRVRKALRIGKVLSVSG